MKKGQYWKNSAVLFAFNIGNLIKNLVPHCSEAKAAHMLAEMAAGTKSILKKDGDFNLNKSETTEDVTREALKSLFEAEQAAYAYKVVRTDAPAFDINAVLQNKDLNGNHKVVYLHLLANPEQPKPATWVECKALGELLGMSDNTVKRALDAIDLYV